MILLKIVTVFGPEILVILLCIVLSYVVFFPLRKSMKESGKRKMNKEGALSEKEELLLFLNNSTTPTVAVDAFAREKNKRCTRFLIPGVAYGTEYYLSVSLEDTHYEFVGSNKKWKVL